MLGGLAFFMVSMQTVGLGVVRAFVPDTRPQAFRIVFALQWLVGILPLIAFALSPEYVSTPAHCSADTLTLPDPPTTLF
jgi:hypothetical protein